MVLASLYAAASMVISAGEGSTWVNRVFVAILSLFVIRFLIVLINEGFRRASELESTGRTPRAIPVARIRPLRSIAVLLVWGAGILFLLSNLGFDITAVVAGLGIGGIAVALGAQAVLGDLFSYFTLLFDRPFEIGDFLIFDGKMGSVEKIGVKTTRIRALSGEQLCVANSDLTGARVHNYKRMEERRVVLKLGVVYGTESEKLHLIPEIIRSAFDEEPAARFDRAHFAGFGDYSLMIEFVFYILSPDYLIYMDVQQRVLLRIYEAFEREEIEFAYPTQVIQLAGQPSIDRPVIGYHPPPSGADSSPVSSPPGTT
jgi:small-conductance mechanosensitive channel